MADGAVAQRGAFHEFGTRNIPQRSFLRAWFDANRAKISSDLKTVARQVVRGASRDALLKALGEEYATAIQDRILAHIPPPLADSTVKRKGHTTPLVDTGELLSAIHYRLAKVA